MGVVFHPWRPSRVYERENDGEGDSGVPATRGERASEKERERWRKKEGERKRNQRGRTVVGGGLEAEGGGF